MNTHPTKASAPNLEGADWIKSSYSNAGGNCIEIANSLPGVVPVRDSKDPHGPTLAFPTSGWSSFVAAVKGGELAG